MPKRNRAVLLAPVFLALSPLLAGEEEHGRRPTREQLERTTSEWRDLASPFYVVRREAEQRLVHLVPADGRQVVEVLLSSNLPKVRRACVRWMLSRFEAGHGADGDRRMFVEALREERDPSVLMDMMHAAARDGPLVELLREELSAGRIRAGFLGDVFDARLVVLLEQVMHEGRIPGFFDGQFAALHALDGSAYWRILRLAWDPKPHFVIRALATMALHEAAHSDLAVQLGPLIIDAGSEASDLARARRWFRADEDSMRSYLRASLSQYVRYSLAKAGVAGPINEKIGKLRMLASRNLQEAEILREAGEEQQYRLVLDQAMGYYFEIGYHHQQLDEYVKAELHYRVVIDQDEVVSSARTAHYNLACIRALQGRKEEALEELKLAVKTGYKDSGWAMRDGDLKSLRDDERFHRILMELDEEEP
ncbi:MAG: hypothetical protein V2A76_15835 [Planctomycetota bacterium]